ncbi:helix-turn-helix domain-containing protein, partial [Proteus mirabilis]|nr:helix-turn-helix domain-containing protein [Proteus mirabilis]
MRTGSVRNPVGYALQLLKAALEGRYHSVSPAETGMKSASLQNMSGTPDVSQHTQTNAESTERSTAS